MSEILALLNNDFIPLWGIVLFFFLYSIKKDVDYLKRDMDFMKNMLFKDVEVKGKKEA